MENAFSALKTDPKLLEKIASAPAHKPSATEIFEQRISFVYGAMPKDSHISREQVRQVIIEQGGTAEAVGAIR